MDAKKLKSILASRNIDLWNLIDTAIDYAASNHRSEFILRRDAFFQKLNAKKLHTPTKSTPTIEEKPDTSSDYDQRNSLLLNIKESLKNENQSIELLIQILRKLEDVDITVKALKETGIGRQINLLKTHRSIEVQRRAKQLIKKWKSIVDASVKSNLENNSLLPIPAVDNLPRVIQAKNDNQSSHQAHLESEFSRNMQRCTSSSDLKNIETVRSPLLAMPTSAKTNEQNSCLSEEQRLEKARKRLRENYQAAEKAKKQRSIKMLDLEDPPKAKGSLIVRIKCRPKRNDEEK